MIGEMRAYTWIIGEKCTCVFMIGNLVECRPELAFSCVDDWQDACLLVHESWVERAIDVGKLSKNSKNPSTTGSNDDQMCCYEITIIKSP